MDSELQERIRAIPSEAFRESEDGFAELSPLERLRWLQQTAWFVWKRRGAAQEVERSTPPEQP